MTIKGLAAKIIAKKGKIAQIEIDGQAVQVGSEFLPRNSKDGDSITIHFLVEDEANVSEKKLAKSILEEILNGN